MSHFEPLPEEKFNEVSAFMTSIIRTFRLSKQQIIAKQEDTQDETAHTIELTQNVRDFVAEWPEGAIQMGNFNVDDVTEDGGHIHIGFVGVRCDGSIPNDVVAYVAHQMAMPVVQLIMESYPDPLGGFLASAFVEAINAQYFERIGRGKIERLKGEDGFLSIIGAALDEMLNHAANPVPFKPEVVDAVNFALKTALDSFDFDGGYADDERD